MCYEMSCSGFSEVCGKNCSCSSEEKTRGRAEDDEVLFRSDDRMRKELIRGTERTDELD